MRSKGQTPKNQQNDLMMKELKMQEAQIEDLEKALKELEAESTFLKQARPPSGRLPPIQH